MVFSSGLQGLSADSDDLDNIFASIKDLDITPERIREFLPKVNWDKLASFYLGGRSGAECEARYVLQDLFFLGSNVFFKSLFCELSLHYHIDIFSG